ncbi:tRNA lysidine(34) synthetase TilS [Leucobacter sp. PH1c]|uniref:tRNA lysidine(34) synthetase TilS n=1 Tax=Leucobacter sp. PH1c TaxID=1397278 RepID=UPI00046A6A7C|nr:tRNA lysidine(34) synthetase TilS [Leucobacter sp. PH1c]
MSDRPLLDTRRAVRRTLTGIAADTDTGTGTGTGTGTAEHAPPLALVALSGGADSLALAAALAHEAPRLNWRAGAILIDHGLQHDSAAVAARAAAQARELGLDPVLVRRVRVAERAPGGPEAAARAARYAAFRDVAEERGARVILTGHTRSDQAEQVLLALARGSGTRSLAGIPEQRDIGESAVLLRPFLAPDPEITRDVTIAACARAGLAPWTDPHNADPVYARVRVRRRVLPVLVEELGAGAAAGLARSADLAREDADALDALAAEALARLRAHPAAQPAPAAQQAPAEPGTAEPHTAQPAPAGPGPAELAQPEPTQPEPAPIDLDARGLAALPAAIRHRVIRRAAAEYGAQLSREHTLAVAALATEWRGQGPAFVPGIRATRAGDVLRLARQQGSPRAARG